MIVWLDFVCAIIIVVTGNGYIWLNETVTFMLGPQPASQQVSQYAQSRCWLVHGPGANILEQAHWGPCTEHWAECNLLTMTLFVVVDAIVPLLLLRLWPR